MNEKRYKYFRAVILDNLHQDDKWGGAHTHSKHLTAGIPKDQRGSKEVLRAVNDLRKEGKIIVKPTRDGKHVSLNSRYLGEIMQEIKKTLKR